jgi:hypothetical protein
VTIIVAAIFGRSSGLISTSQAEVLGSVARACHAKETKWCIPGVLGVAGSWVHSPEKSSRAISSLISAAKPGGRRRADGGEPDVLDCVFAFSYRVFPAKKRDLIFKY